jgi:hypothetical protein
LLERVREAMGEQRQCLIAGDASGLGRANRVLGDLVEQQRALCREGLEDNEEAEGVRRLAEEVREEVHTNYLLACRGAQFADFTLSLLCGGRAPEPAAEGRRGARVLDAHS